MSETEIRERLFSQCYSTYQEDYERTRKEFDLPDRRKDYLDRMTGKAAYLERLFARTGKCIAHVECLEEMLSEEYPGSETGDEIRALLSFEMYPALAKCLHEIWEPAQHSWLEHDSKKISKLHRAEATYWVKADEIKQSIQSKEILHRLSQNEAIRFEIDNSEELNRKIENSRSPGNRGALGNAGDLWIIADEPEKAEKYYLKAGPNTYEHAIEVFRKRGDTERVRKFLLLAVEDPVGYSEGIRYKQAGFYEELGEPEKAKEVLRQYACHLEKCSLHVDLHGEWSNAPEEAASIWEKLGEKERAQRCKEKAERLWHELYE